MFQQFFFASYYFVFWVESIENPYSDHVPSNHVILPYSPYPPPPLNFIYIITKTIWKSNLRRFVDLEEKPEGISHNGKVHSSFLSQLRFAVFLIHLNAFFDILTKVFVRGTFSGDVEGTFSQFYKEISANGAKSKNFFWSLCGGQRISYFPLFFVWFKAPFVTVITISVFISMQDRINLY